MKKLSVLLSLSLCTILIAEDEISLAPDAQDITLVEKLFEQHPDLRPFYDSLSDKEQAEFAVVIEEVRDLISQALHDFNTITENHYGLINKLKEFYNEEQFAITIGFAKASQLKMVK